MASAMDAANTAEATTSAVFISDVTGQTTGQIVMYNRSKDAVSCNGFSVCGQTELQSNLNIKMAPPPSWILSQG